MDSEADTNHRCNDSDVDRNNDNDQNISKTSGTYFKKQIKVILAEFKEQKTTCETFNNTIFINVMEDTFNKLEIDRCVI